MAQRKAGDIEGDGKVCKRQYHDGADTELHDALLGRLFGPINGFGAQVLVKYNALGVGMVIQKMKDHELKHRGVCLDEEHVAISHVKWPGE